MATLATAGYGAHALGSNTNGFADDGVDGDEEYISTFFVQALYDYQSTDPSSLSFRKDDIIEVLTRLESGWWDGLLGDERGWFPSNYVTIVPASAAPPEPEPPAVGATQQQLAAAAQPRRSIVDMADVMGGDDEADWAGAGADLQRAVNGIAGVKLQTDTSTTDFWVPRVTTDGQV
jgi:son of sevenless